MTVVQPNIRMLQLIVNYELTALTAETVQAVRTVIILFIVIDN
jgi:hypothetical protein